PVLVRVFPSAVTIETNQPIRFRGEGETSTGKIVAAPVAWEATGGVIHSDGTFSSTAVGSFKVVGGHRWQRPGGRDKKKSDRDQHDRKKPQRDYDWARSDTSIVFVVPPQRDLQRIVIAPDTVTLTAGDLHSFTATGYLKNGSATTIAVQWAATGGAIDASGAYTAGQIPGSFRVVARNTAGNVADTASVAVAASTSTPTPGPTPNPDQGPVPAPVPDPASPPPSEPTLVKVVLKPSSASLVPGATKTFAAYGRNSAGDSVAVNVTFSATGGSVTASGLYTAGKSTGTYRVVAAASGLADTSVVTLAPPIPAPLPPPPPPAPPPGKGLAFGPFHLPSDSMGRPGVSYNAAVYTVSPAFLRRHLDMARSRGGRLLLAVPRSRSKDGAGRISGRAVGEELSRWKSAVDLNPYIQDGTVAGIYVTDEPNCASCWGGTTANQTQVDSMAMFSKRLWPRAVTYARVAPSWFKTTPKYLDAAWAQYDGPYRDGPPEQYRDQNLAAAAARGMKVVIWINTLDGGCGKTSACMPGVPGVDIWGTFPNAASVRRWQMSAAEVLHYGKIFLGHGKPTTPTCLALHWQWSPVFKSTSGRTSAQMAAIQAFDRRPDVKAAMAELARIAASRPVPNCLVR
ncbi:MAG: hypothetical protein ACREMX_01195, partial [Gemmatimonadales bacterium]